jgi:hypothetical protein
MGLETYIVSPIHGPLGLKWIMLLLELNDFILENIIQGPIPLLCHFHFRKCYIYIFEVTPFKKYYLYDWGSTLSYVLYLIFFEPLNERIKQGLVGYVCITHKFVWLEFSLQEFFTYFGSRNTDQSWLFPVHLKSESQNKYFKFTKLCNKIE